MFGKKLSESMFFQVLPAISAGMLLVLTALLFLSWPAVFLLSLISATSLSAYFLYYRVAVPLRTLAHEGGEVLRGRRKKINLSSSITDLQRISRVFEEMGSMMEEVANTTGTVARGDLTQRISPDFGNKELAESVNAMIAQLHQNSEKEQIRSKYTAGLAAFADILRTDNENTEQWTNRIVSELVKFLEINQGGLFLTEDDAENKPVLRLRGCYAYGRKKHLNKEVYPGDGLLGQCYLECDTVHLTEIPQGYATITSGLGQAGPTALLLCPLIYNDKVYGVLELAGFKNFAPYEIDFVKKLSENIAAAVHYLSSNLRTKQLLNESLMRQEQMRAQEEEMRQNMEEMQAIQEEMLRKNETLRLNKIAGIQQAARQTAIRIKADVDTALDAARTLSQVFAVFKQMPRSFDSPREQANAMLQSVLRHNPDFLATYTLWEPQAFDGNDLAHAHLPGHDATGRFIPYHTLDGDAFHLEPLVNYTIAGDGDYFLIPQSTRNEAVINPYKYPVRGVEVWIMSAVVPIMYHEDFLGICGVDFSIEHMQKIINNIKIPVHEATITVLAHNGTIVKSTLAHLHTGDPSHLAIPSTVLPDNFDTPHSNEANGMFYWFQPIRFGKTTTPWCACIACPADELYKG